MDKIMFPEASSTKKKNFFNERERDRETDRETETERQRETERDRDRDKEKKRKSNKSHSYPEMNPADSGQPRVAARFNTGQTNKHAAQILFIIAAFCPFVTSHALLPSLLFFFCFCRFKPQSIQPPSDPLWRAMHKIC